MMSWNRAGVLFACLALVACGEAFTQADDGGADGPTSTTTTGAGAGGNSDGGASSNGGTDGPGGSDGAGGDVSDGGAGGYDGCLTCQEAISSPHVSSSDVCSGDHKNGFLNLRLCVCENSGTGSVCADDCEGFCGGQSMSSTCAVCLSTSSCDDELANCENAQQ